MSRPTTIRPACVVVIVAEYREALRGRPKAFWPPAE